MSEIITRESYSDFPYDSDETIAQRFKKDRIMDLTEQYLEEGIECDIKSELGDRKFVVSYIKGDSQFADIPLSVETDVFSKIFKQKPSQIIEDYGKYDSQSIFATVIDASAERPVPAGILRIIQHHSEVGFKDVNDLVKDVVDNPWIDEIKSQYFSKDEEYSPSLAWARLGEREGVNLVLNESLDIATHASSDEYRGAHGDINGVSMLFYHSCLRYALAHQKNNLLAIFDIPPLENLQQFGNPFETYSELNPHPYGGPYDTLPAYCVIERGMNKIRDNSKDIGRVFIDGLSLNDNALLPNEYMPEVYSNEINGFDSI